MSIESGSPEAGSATETPSLRESLEASMDAAEKAVETQDPGTQAEGGEKSTDVSEAARTLASARKAAEEAKAAETKPGEIKPEAKPEAEEAVDAPAHWSARDREFFSKQAPEVKSWLLNRHKAMEADYTRRVQETAHVRREADELREIFKPFQEAMASDGMTIPMATRQLVAAHQKLISDPQGGIRWLAEKYGIDLKAVTEGAAADQAGESPTVKALRNEVAELRKWRDQSTTSQQSEQHHANVSKVQQFAEEKDAQGNLLRPHFDEVAKDISTLLRAARESGEQLTLQDAYDRAIYANPAVRQKVLAAQDAERRSKEEAERKQKADAARRAGFDVKGEGSAAALAPASESLRAALERAMDAQMGRV